MDRREFLTTLTVGTAALSGCSLLDGGNDSETATPYAVPTDERPANVQSTTVTPTESDPLPPREWLDQSEPPAVAEMETAARTLALAPIQYSTSDSLQYAVRIAATATADHPALVQAMVFNDNDFEKTVNRARFPLFARSVPAGRYAEPIGRAATNKRQGTLVLVPTPTHDLVEEPLNVVEQDQDGYWHASVHPGDHPYGGTMTIPPRGGVVGTYAVTGGFGNGPLRPGTYRFSGTGLSATASLRSPLVAVVWKTNAPGPTVESRFDSSQDPAFDQGGSVQWFHQADRQTARYLLPDHEAVELPGAVTARLVNRARRWDSGRLTLYKNEDGRWYDLGPNRLPRAVHSLQGGREFQSRDEQVDEPPIPVEDYRLQTQPNGAVQFSLGLNHGPPRGPVSSTVGYLGGGRYALVVAVSREDQQYGMLFDVDAPTLTAWPEHDVSVARDGSTVTVTDPGVETAEDATATIVARRVESESAIPLIDEQVMGQYGAAARNTLSELGDGVQTVRYLSADSAQSYAFSEISGNVVRFDGVTARLVVESAQ